MGSWKLGGNQLPQSHAAAEAVLGREPRPPPSAPLARAPGRGETHPCPPCCRDRGAQTGIRTSWASSHLSRFSSASRLLMICTKFWKEEEEGPVSREKAPECGSAREWGRGSAGGQVGGGGPLPLRPPRGCPRGPHLRVPRGGAIIRPPEDLRHVPQDVDGGEEVPAVAGPVLGDLHQCLDDLGDPLPGQPTLSLRQVLPGLGRCRAGVTSLQDPPGQVPRTPTPGPSAAPSPWPQLTR